MAGIENSMFGPAFKGLIADSLGVDPNSLQGGVNLRPMQTPYQAPVTGNMNRPQLPPPQMPYRQQSIPQSMILGQNQFGRPIIDTAQLKGKDNG